MNSPYKRSVFGADTGIGHIDPPNLHLDMGPYAGSPINSHAFGAGHQYGAAPGFRGLGATDPAGTPAVVVTPMVPVISVTQAPTVSPPRTRDAAAYSFWGAFAGTAAMGAVLMLKYPKLPRGVGFVGVLPLLGVAAGQWLATRKV